MGNAPAPSFAYCIIMKRKILLIILTIASGINFYYSRDWLSALALAVIAIALVLAFVKGEKK